MIIATRTATSSSIIAATAAALLTTVSTDSARAEQRVKSEVAAFLRTGSARISEKMNVGVVGNCHVSQTSSFDGSVATPITAGESS